MHIFGVFSGHSERGGGAACCGSAGIQGCVRSAPRPHPVLRDALAAQRPVHVPGAAEVRGASPARRVEVIKVTPYKKVHS